MSSTVLYEHDGGVATVTLNRPDQMNTLAEDLPERVLGALARRETQAVGRLLTPVEPALGAVSRGRRSRTEVESVEEGVADVGRPRLALARRGKPDALVAGVDGDEAVAMIMFPGEE